MKVWVTGALLALLLAPAAAEARGDVTLRVLSNRADLVSGGNALLRVEVPEDVGADAVKVTLGDRDVTEAFTLRESGQITGLVDGLAVGENVIEARLADGRGARLTITNHPRGGPVFAGPQVQPWVCTTELHGLGKPGDDQCNAPTKVSYLYQPEDAEHGEYEPYDPENPPDDIATTTTDEGREVPYIVRVEEGTLDRSIYKTMVLADPSKPWTGTNPQEAWNRKLFVTFAGGCGTVHLQMPPNPLSDSASDGGVSQPELLARGWMSTSSGLNTFNFNCNEVVSAEAVMMMKEHIVETYGPIRRTISAGGSGGSVQQHNIASAYPGLLDGIVPTQSFPDLWNMVWDATECYLQYRYFTTISPHLWLDQEQRLAVAGKKGVVSCGEFIALFSDPFDPQHRGLFQSGVPAVRFGCMLPPTQTYHPIANPRGARCSVQDLQNAIWGHGGPRDAAPLPYDNTGVQYGLNALQSGTISPEQFVDLNASIGALDNEGDFTAGRASMDATTATTMYRASRTTDPRQLAKVPILDVRSVPDSSRAEELSDMHQPYNSHVMRARLDAVNGTHANQVFWRMVPENKDIAAVLAIDRWLQAVEDDRSDLPLEQKIIRNKPAGLVDTCWIDDEPVTDAAACDTHYAHGGDARTAAGSPLRDDTRKCQLKSLRRGDYRFTFTGDQWQRLQAAFPAGVCDWTRPSVGYQPSIPWMTYANGPGGTPLGAAPTSTPTMSRPAKKQ